MLANFMFPLVADKNWDASYIAYVRKKTWV